MDFDLFDMEDDDIISSVCIIPTEDTINTPSNLYPEFNCSGDDSLLNSQLSTDSFAKNHIIFNKNYCEIHQCNIELTTNNFNRNSLHSTMVVDHIFNNSRMQIQKLATSFKTAIVNDEITYYQSRRQVTLLYYLINSLENTLQWKNIDNHLQNIRNLLDRIGNTEFFKMIYLANSSKGNSTESPAYHILHGFLEWRILDLVILKNHEENIKGRQEDLFECRLNKVIQDLLQISICLYKKRNLPDLIFTSSFPCTCIKETWLILQMLTEDYSANNNNDVIFWKYFNEAIDKLKANPEKYGLSTQSISQFSIWLLKGLVQLQGYNSNGHFIGTSSTRIVENFDLLESIVKIFFNSNASEEEIRIFLCNLMPILLEWWPPKADIPMIIWEYFNKKLNSSFFIAGSAPSNLAVASSSGKGYLEKIRKLLENSLADVNLCSFSLYQIILGKTIKRFLKSNQNNQLQKIFGRIFSKFSTSKFLALNETGLHNLIELFLILGLSGVFCDVAQKLKDKLLSINFEKITLNRQICLTKGHVAMLMLFTENSLDISDYIKKLLERLNLIKMDLNVSKIIADGMYDIFEKLHNFDLGEDLLIDSWLPNYLNACNSAEQERTLEAIHMIFEKIKNSTNFINLNAGSINNYQNLFKSLNLFILPYVKQNLVTSFSIWLPKLAAEFCILSTGNDQFQKLFKFFVELNCSNKQAVLRFLLDILLSDKAILIDNSIIIQIWLKNLVLLTSNNEDVVSLTKIVTTLDDFQYICNLSQMDLLAAKEPLCIFISTVGNNYESCTDLKRKFTISDKFNSYLLNFDKWLSDKNEKSDISYRFYSFIAIVIFNCANIVYAKSKITCFFHVAITRFILPQAIQTGKVPEQKFAQMVHKIWPVLIQGIGKLNFKNDPYITKTLTDLIVKWLPHFKISQNSKVVSRPFVNCLTNDNEQLSLFVFEKLTTVFLAMQRRQTDPNACLVITIFQEIIDTFSNDENKLKIFIKATCLIALEHLMMVDEIVPSRVLLLDLLKKIIKSSAFSNSNEIRDLIIEHLKVITIKHLSYFTFFYFELLTQIANICVELVEGIMEFLLEQIKIVENKRGVGEDNRLRNCLNKLKGAILAIKSKRC